MNDEKLSPDMFDSEEEYVEYLSRRDIPPPLWRKIAEWILIILMSYLVVGVVGLVAKVYMWLFILGWKLI